MAHHFTLRQAEALLADVSEKIQQGVHLKAELVRVTSELETVAQRVAMSGGVLLDRSGFIASRSRQEAMAKRLRELIQEIHATGCQVKDLDRGLLDFPSYYRGNEVMLCWMLGESSISYWHSSQEGFRGRKVIDRDFVENHWGDPPG